MDNKYFQWKAIRIKIKIIKQNLTNNMKMIVVLKIDTSMIIIQLPPF